MVFIGLLGFGMRVEAFPAQEPNVHEISLVYSFKIFWNNSWLFGSKGQQVGLRE